MNDNRSMETVRYEYLKIRAVKHEPKPKSLVKVNSNIFVIVNRILTPLAKGFLQVVVWGGGHSLTYVQDNNVYYVEDPARPKDVTVLTNEGVVGQVYFGVTDWIYEG